MVRINYVGDGRTHAIVCPRVTEGTGELSFSFPPGSTVKVRVDDSMRPRAVRVDLLKAADQGSGLVLGQASDTDYSFAIDPGLPQGACNVTAVVGPELRSIDVCVSEGVTLIDQR